MQAAAWVSIFGQTGEPSYLARPLMPVEKAMPEAVIVGAVRTPIGRRAGSLKDCRPGDLAGFALRALSDRTGIAPKIVRGVVLCCVTQVDAQGMNSARLAPPTR